ncbi:MAG: hypothetical protein KDA72_15990, partial [Planctomycetales bacterium]|nr:hypothetical protein [Planctomycetales bacterium]
PHIVLHSIYKTSSPVGQAHNGAGEMQNGDARQADGERSISKTSSPVGQAHNGAGSFQQSVP